jgi:hypothetical protein
MAKNTIQEDETKNVLKVKYFADYDWTRVIGKIDLCVRSQPELGALPVNYLWAETKQGKKRDIYESFIQLILTIGRWRIFEDEMPPYFLGAADAEKIAFVEYNKVMHIFSKNDFNWNVTPSDHTTKEFRELYALLHDDLASDIQLFKYAFDDKALRSFIRLNFKQGRKDVKKQSVGKNNFTFVYFDWVRSVKDSISVDWKSMEKAGILDCDFFLADLMSKDGMSIKDKLKVVLEKTKYKILRKVEADGLFSFSEISFRDGQKAYDRFWNRYERPPKPIYQRYILDRRDLLVPQDIREIKGSYYTPEEWVRLSQEYLARTLGEDWQEEYYVWDCAAGSGNLLRGLTNTYNIYASTLDDSDVKVMHDAIDGGRLNLVKSNVFQFDFLNDGYTKDENGAIVSALSTCQKIPESLRRIIADPEKRKKLVIYINAPYKEATNGRTSAGTGKNNTGATKDNMVWQLYKDRIGAAINELFAQFSIRVAIEIPSSVLAEFSTLKILQAPNFSEFRRCMRMELRSLFLMPGDTFDNVTGKFPIGFQIYQTGVDYTFDQIEADVYSLVRKDVVLEGKKVVACYDSRKLINPWVSPLIRTGTKEVAYTIIIGNDFQHSRYVNILSSMPKSHGGVKVGKDGLIAAAIYQAVRNIPVATWLNDRDQFLAPKDSWAGDLTFQTDCLIWSIFNNAVHEENRVCHWIPFYENEVGSPGSFNSRFMADYLYGKIERKKHEAVGDLFSQMAVEETASLSPIDAMSDEAKSVLEAGKKIWCYYMSKPGVSVNASFLDIRAFFQGYKVTDKGKTMMNSSSQDAEYMRLWTELKQATKALEARIEPKIYEHGFLLE